MPKGKTSAGILLFRRSAGGALEVLLAHPGGPFWARKDDGAWSIPKGELDAVTESPYEAAKREFTEETGAAITGRPLALVPVKQAGGKIVHAFAVEQDLDPGSATSNTFSMEWPPRSGRQQQFPEVDRVAWFSPEVARAKLLTGQVPLLEQLLARLAAGPGVDTDSSA